MAEKKKIKNIKDGTGSGDGAQITVTDIVSGGGGSAGTAAVAEVTFDQPGYKALCFGIGDVINTESITVAGASVIVSARRIQRGTVTAITSSNLGTISENKTNKNIAFDQPYVKEKGIAVGTEVKYDLVYDFKTGGEVAVNVEIQP
jgi:hypothetical protein